MQCKSNEQHVSVVLDNRHWHLAPPLVPHWSMSAANPVVANTTKKTHYCTTVASMTDNEQHTDSSNYEAVKRAEISTNTLQIEHQLLVNYQQNDCKNYITE